MSHSAKPNSDEAALPSHMLLIFVIFLVLQERIENLPLDTRLLQFQRFSPSASVVWYAHQVAHCQGRLLTHSTSATRQQPLWFRLPLLVIG